MEERGTAIDLHSLASTWSANVQKALYALANCDGDRHRLLKCHERLVSNRAQFQQAIQVGALDPQEETTGLEHFDSLLSSLSAQISAATDTTVSATFTPV